MDENQVVLISVDDINILNPRVRSQIIAESIRENIKQVGLKRPITVTLGKYTKKYDLVCGQGRLEVYIGLGELEIPAIIIEVSSEDALLMSLIENTARRQSNSLELIQSIRYLRTLGYEDESIAEKTNLGKTYIKGIIRLLEGGEEYLVNAVEKGRIPLHLALKIVAEDDSSMQRIMTEIYESGGLTGKSFVAVQKMITRRKHYGKGFAGHRNKKSSLSIEELRLDFEQTLKELKQLKMRSDYIKDLLIYTRAALKQLTADIHFSNQLKAVGMNDIPEHIVKLLKR